jgi:hypothetical protein
MLNFLPALIILVTLIIVISLRISRVQLGSIWLIMIILSLFTWGGVILLRFHLPQPLVLRDWFPLVSGNDPLTLGITENSWLLLFILAGLMTGILLNSAGHLQEERIFNIWLEILSLAAIGMIVLLANSVLAFLILWGLLDVVEIVIFTIINHDQTIGVKTYAIFFTRILGLCLVMLAAVLQYQSQIPLELGSASGKVLALLAVGASLRLGVFPIHLPFTRDLPQRRSVATILRFLVPLSAFSFLSQLAAPDSITGIYLIIELFAILSSLVGSINWLKAKNELEGRPYWLLAFSGLALVSYLHGHPVSVLVWGLIMVSIGGWIFLNELKGPQSNYFLPILLLTISAVPFSPVSIGILGISGGGMKIFNPLLWISLIILAAGVLRFSHEEEEGSVFLENWMKFFCVIGLGILALSSWIVIPLKVAGWNQMSTWAASISVFLLLAFAAVLFYSKGIRTRILNYRIVQNSKIIMPFTEFLNQLFHFDWFYRFLAWIISLQGMAINGINSILEGEGSILWALVFLALMISILVSGAGLNG